MREVKDKPGRSKNQPAAYNNKHPHPNSSSPCRQGYYHRLLNVEDWYNNNLDMRLVDNGTMSITKTDKKKVTISR